MEFKKFFDWNKDGLRKPSKPVVKPTYDPNWIQLSTLQILKIWMIDKMLGKKDLAKEYSEWKTEQHRLEHEGSLGHNPEPENVEIYHLAIVIDGEVYDVMRTQKALADVLLARPEFILFSPSEQKVYHNMKYIDGKFVDDGEHQH